MKLKVACNSVCSAVPDPAPSLAQRDAYAAKVTFTAAWSDQFPGSTANGWDSAKPNKGNATGPGGRSYALMAVRNDDFGYVRVKYKLEPGEPAVRDAVKFAMVSGGAAGVGESGACPSASGTIGSAEACVKIQSPNLNDYNATWGVDRNKDGKLDADETETVVGDPSAWKFRIVSSLSYAQALEKYNAGVYNEGLQKFGPLARHWLESFRDGFAPGGGLVAFHELNFGSDFSGLVHANGGVTSSTSDRRAISKEVIHQPGSTVVRVIMDSPGFYGWIYETLQIKAGEINAALGARTGPVVLDMPVIPGVGGVPKLWTVASNTPGITFGDLYAILGDAQDFRPTLRIKVSRNRLDAGDLYIETVQLAPGSQIRDLFDFDYDIRAGMLGFRMNFAFWPTLGPMAQAGAMLQAAHGTIGGNGGMAFLNVYLLDSTRVFDGRHVRIPR